MFHVDSIQKFLPLLLLFYSSVTNGSGVVVLYPAADESHHILCKTLSEHDVANFDEKSNYYDIHSLEDSLSDVVKSINTSEFESFDKLIASVSLVTDLLMTDANVYEWQNDNVDIFDHTIVHYITNNKSFGDGVKFNGSIIILSSLSVMLPWIASATRSALAAESVSNFMTTHPNIWQRTSNAAVAVLSNIISNHKTCKKYFFNKSRIVSYKELMHRIGIRKTRSAVDVPANSSQDLKTIMDSAKDGVIYLNLGNITESKSVNDDFKRIILNTLSSFKETIIWKSDEDIQETPKNIYIKKWISQANVLAHPNVKLFISHGGLLSSTEATHFGIPMLIIPIHQNQLTNARFFSDRGQAIILSYDNITEASLISSLNEILTNSSYYENAQKYPNLIMYDVPIKPKNHLVIKRGGAPHLMPPYPPRISQLTIDVWILVLVPLHGIVFYIIYICQECFKRKYYNNVDKFDNKYF